MAGKVNRQDQLKKTGSSLTFNEILKLHAARQKEYTIQGIYKFGYRNKEDISNLPASTLVVGSQNVLTNAAEQIAIRNGYSLDGAAGNQNTYGIDSSFDFNTHINGIRNLRKWGTNLEVRYVNPSTNAVSWMSLLSTLIATNVANFCTFWDGVKNICLFVNGDSKIWRWSGALASYLSSTATTIVVSGSTTLANLGFDSSGTLLIDGTQYTYTSAGVIAATTFSQAPNSSNIALSGGTWASQLFTTGAAATQILTATAGINSSGIDLGIPINFIGSIYTDNAGVPGTLVGSTQGTMTAFSGGPLPVSFYFNLNVSPATNYHFVIQYVTPPGGTSSTYSVEIGASGGVGTNTSANSGATWSASNGYMYATIVENDSNLQTFSGVSPAPSGIAVGDAIMQAVTVGAANVIGAPLPTFDLIANLSNQIYYGSFTFNTVYISKINNYIDATFSSPRVPGEGGLVTLDAPPVGFKAQAKAMYISSGKGQWWQTLFTLSADLTKESFQITPLQTASNQGAQSQALIGKLKNSIVFVSNEPIVNAFGPVKDILGDPNFVNMSDPIKYDIDAYDFTGGEIYYSNYFIYIPLPAMGIERLYNVQKKYWEAPQVVPFSRHYEVNGVLFAHSGLTNESYQCYVSGLYSDNGNPINCVIAFPYLSQEGGAANQLKNFNKHYLEGYIAANTTLLLTINYDFGGFTGTYTTTITGTEAGIIFNKITDGSIGQNTLGSEPIGSILNLPNQPAIPKFRIINTFPRLDCYEYQIVISSDDVDQQFAILRSGPAVAASDSLGVQITH